MKSMRVTKYKPQNRDEKGLYTLVDEWTSISDVGKKYHGQIFTMEQYLATEEKYIQAVEVLMQKAKVNHLKMLDLENHSHDTALNLSEGKTIPITLVRELVKMILREEVWGRLVAKNQFEIHFGYDYYMYFVGESLSEDIIEELSKIDSLYVEDVQSPHFD
ncbi:hypothetical protein [Planococcus halocryophilus]|uniref:Uncharacterized protein n=1 Tax=Planococcus halocryophilus TaxID=1215089 RepID=A0A1C7DN49_9BACL|nr:hypothetical protein [Planococcus halocryophilus]ANU13020.1 hypothetical protein BBI08_03800 [Planococcus halocryophilus]